MTHKKQGLIDQNLQDLNNDGVDRRGFLKCMAWAGTGLVWTMSGGIPVSRAFAKSMGKDAGHGGDFSCKHLLVKRHKCGKEPMRLLGPTAVLQRASLAVLEVGE